MAEPVELPAVEKRANPWIRALAASPFAAILPLLVAAAVVHPAIAVFTFHLVVLGTIATLFARRLKPLARNVPVTVHVEGDELAIRDAKGKTDTLAVSRITNGLKLPRAGGITVRLGQKRRVDRELTFETEAEADALLGAIGKDVAHSTATFRGMSRTYASTARLFATIFGVMGAGAVLAVIAGAAAAALGTNLLPLAMLPTMAFFAALLWPSRIDVGGDGVLITWLGRKRFIAHREIETVSTTQMGFGRSRRNVAVLTLQSGEAVNLPTGSPVWDSGHCELLAERIRQARRTAEEGGVAPSALLLRGDRDLGEWVRALRTRDVTDLRSPAVSKDHFWRVIEDPGADPAMRAAAVVALGTDLTDTDRQRLARAAKVVAAPKLRVVLEDGPDASEEEVAEMLEEVEAGSERRRRA
ncbi:MAG: hypothetical protein AB7S26_05130 [Sandaracinaceae bacterium]